MRIIVSIIILCLVWFSSNVEAQTKKQKKTSKVTKNKTVKTVPKIVSVGVVNGKAIDLTKPEYPKSASSLNVYGAVQVQVLIDEFGNVITAKAILGHPLLRAASIKAALESKFQPIILGGEAVRINGIIIYHFMANEWNWLEIGYAINSSSDHYTTQRLLDLFPSSYADERQLLKQYFAENVRDKDFLQTVIASIQGRLSGNEKNLWLFSVGLWLGKANRCCWNDLQKQDLVQQINFLIISKPDNAKSALIFLLENVGSLLETSDADIYGTKIYSLLKDSESKFPFLGR